MTENNHWINGCDGNETNLIVTFNTSMYINYNNTSIKTIEI